MLDLNLMAAKEKKKKEPRAPLKVWLAGGGPRLADSGRRSFSAEAPGHGARYCCLPWLDVPAGDHDARRSVRAEDGRPAHHHHLLRRLSGQTWPPGCFYLLTVWLGYAQPDVAGHVHDYGTKFLVTAGLLNVLALVDVYEIAAGKKS